MDVYQYAVKLQKGNNRILIQLGNSEVGNSNYMFRLTDMNGKLLTNLKTSYSYTAYNKATAYPVKSYPFFAEKAFEEKLATSLNFIDQLMLVHVYNHNDKRFEARKIAQQLKKEQPLSTLISEVMVETYNRDNNSIDLNKEIEFIKTNDSLSLYALILLANDANGREDFNEADRLLKKRIELYGANVDTEIKFIDILAKKKDYEAVLKELDKAYKAYPDEATFVSMQYTLTENMTKDLKKANDVLISYLKNNYNEEFNEAMIANKMKLGKVDDGM
jgi:tetratricopeptide (TPR) repeat protein